MSTVKEELEAEGSSISKKADVISESSSSSSISSLSEKPTRKQKFFGYIWDSYNKPAAERKAMIKLDLTLLSLATFSTFMKYLDKSNVSNAFVSGMKEDISLYGNQVSNGTVAYSVASIIFAFPAAMLLARSNAKWFIIAIEVFWTVITFCMSVIQNGTQLIVMRGLLGIFECPHFPGLVYMLGSYYTKEEIARRTVILQSATAIGPMFSGYLQAAAYNGLDGVAGRAGWRWLFIIDGIFSLGLILFMVVFFPTTLGQQKPNFIFTEADLNELKKRKPKERDVIVHKYTFKDVSGYFLRPESYLWWCFGATQSVSNLPSTSMSYYLKAWATKKTGAYTVAQIDNYPTVIYATQFLIAIIAGWMSDTVLKGRRWPPIIVAGLIQFVVDLLLGLLNIWKYRAFRFFLYYNTSWTLGVCGMYWSWVQERFEGDPKERSFMTGGINVSSFIIDIIFNLTLYKTTLQPEVKYGNIVSSIFALLYAALGAGLAYKEYRRWRSSQVTKGV